MSNTFGCQEYVLELIRENPPYSVLFLNIKLNDLVLQCPQVHQWQLLSQIFYSDSTGKVTATVILLPRTLGVGSLRGLDGNYESTGNRYGICKTCIMVSLGEGKSSQIIFGNQMAAV